MTGSGGPSETDPGGWVAASDRKSDESIFGRNSDPIVEAKAKIFENPIHFNLIELKQIELISIFYIFVEFNRIHFYFLSDWKIKTASDPIR